MSVEEWPSWAPYRPLFALFVAIVFAFCSPASVIAQTSPDASSTTQNTNDNVEATVRAYFADTPVMVAIAKCESEFRQYDDNGQPLHGGQGGMIGVFQEAQSIHADLAQSLGMDINTLSGNLAYAKQLFLEEGTVPWNASKSCWGPKIKALVKTAAAQDPTPLQSTLTLGTISPEVTTLQKLLNNAGFIVAKSGPGSAGQETPKFGKMTQLALQRFQCAKNIVCSGDESTTGYGAVGPTTRSALSSAGNLSKL